MYGPHQPSPTTISAYGPHEEYVCSSDIFFSYPTEHTNVAPRPFSASSTSTNNSLSNDSCSSNSNVIDTRQMLPCSFQSNPLQQSPNQHHQFQQYHQMSPFSPHHQLDQPLPGYASVIVDTQQYAQQSYVRWVLYYWIEKSWIPLLCIISFFICNILVRCSMILETRPLFWTGHSSKMHCRRQSNWSLS